MIEIEKKSTYEVIMYLCNDIFLSELRVGHSTSLRNFRFK